MKTSSRSLRELIRFESKKHGHAVVAAKACEEDGCLCDNVTLHIQAEGKHALAELTADGNLFDEQGAAAEPLWRDLVVEAWPRIQRPFEELVAARRAEVLEMVGRRQGSFEVRVPAELLGAGADPGAGVLGQLQHGGATYSHRLEFCSDPGCECEKLFLVVWRPGEDGHSTFLIQKTGEWAQVEAGRPEIDMDAVEQGLVSDERFCRLWRALSIERLLQRYHAFLARRQADGAIDRQRLMVIP